MKVVKRIGYKLIVVLCLIMTFWCFIASTPVDASKVKTNEFYYSGTTKGSYVVNKSFLSKLVDAFAALIDYILGLSVLGFKMVFVGWTELIEWALTAMLQGASGISDDLSQLVEEKKSENPEMADMAPTDLLDSDQYVTIEAIVLNHIPLFDVNIFDLEPDAKYDGLGRELTYPDGSQPEKFPEDSLILIIRQAIASWYYTFRLISIMVMLLLLIYIGIKLAISSIAKDKALYKKMLTDWLVGMIIVFTVHYIMVFMIGFNEILVDQIAKLKLTYKPLMAYEYGIMERRDEGAENEDLEVSIYDEVRTRAYDAKLSVGFPGVAMYMVLVYYAWRFTFMYLKRYLIIAVLTMLAPLVAVTYAFNKVKSGKATIFTNWLKEYFFMVILQSIHALIYMVFFQQALALSLASIGGMILSFVLLHMMTDAEKLFRKIFNIKGSLTDNTADTKLSNVKNFATTAMAVPGMAKMAGGMTKASARVLTKPFRSAANYGFGKYMEKKAAKIDKEFEEAKKSGNLTSKELEALKEATRNNKLQLGALAVDIKNGKFKGDKEIDAAILKLKEAIPMAKDNGEELTDDEYIENFRNRKDTFATDYEKMTTNAELWKHEFSQKWKKIMDPYQYVEKQADGSFRRIKTEREHEDWGPIFKYLSKKKKGVGAQLGQYTNMEYLFNMNDDTRKAIGEQLKDIGNVLTGFVAGIAGLPMMIVEPGLGFALLAKGISSTHDLMGDSDSRIRKKNLQGFQISETTGKYYFAGYEGKSVSTIANGAQAYLREAATDIQIGKVEHNREVIRRTKKHKKLYDRLKGAATITAVGATAGGTLHTIANFVPPPVAVGTVAGLAGGAVLTGKILGSMKSNAYTHFQDALRASKAAGVADRENQIKSTDEALDLLADKYYEIQEQKESIEVDRTTERFGAIYAAALAEAAQEVDQMDEKQLLRETGYKEPEIVVTTTPDGKKQLAGDVESKLIDDAIIETAEKSGIINITECKLDASTMKQVNKVITDRLIEKGVITKEQKADDIIDKLEEKIQNQKATLDRERPQAVEEKMTDDAIVDVMKEKNISDPSRVVEDDVMAKFETRLSRMTDVPTSQTTQAIENMSQGAAPQQKKDSPLATAKVDSVRERVRENVGARKQELQTKADRTIDDKLKEKLKSELKKKKIVAIDAMVLQQQDQLESGIKASEQDSSDKTFGGAVSTSDGSKAVSSSDGGLLVPSSDGAIEVTNSDNIIKMLQLQTDLHKSKQKLAVTKQHTTEESRKKIEAYRAELIRPDGSVRVDNFRDGSRRVTAQGETTMSGGVSIEDIMKKMKSEKMK